MVPKSVNSSSDRSQYETKDMKYIGEGMTLHDLKNENEFLIIDTVPNKGEGIARDVPRLFKFIFPRSIAISTSQIDEDSGYLVREFKEGLVKASQGYSAKNG